MSDLRFKRIAFLYLIVILQKVKRFLGAVTVVA
jgi:hypothetical protein